MLLWDRRRVLRMCCVVSVLEGLVRMPTFEYAMMINGRDIPTWQAVWI